MGSVHSTRKTRKSMPAQLDLGQENSTQSKDSSPISAPQSSRRKSRPSANAGAKITKPPAAKDQSTPATAKGKALENGTAATPAKQPVSTPHTSTRSSRRDRKSTRTPSSHEPATQNENEQHQSQSPNKPSNTVRLNVGRKSLESILAQQQPQDHDMIDTPGQENGDYHFDYDPAMYKNNFGLDGHMDAPTSPTSHSTSTSTAARMSGRTRKPTIRAMESLASEKRNRRTRAPSKPAETTETTPATTRSRQKSAEQSPAPASNKPDVLIVAKQIYELAAAAVAPDFVSPPEIETWFKELHQKVDDRKKEKEVVIAEPAEVVEPEVGQEVEAEAEAEAEVEAELEPEPEPAPEPEREATPPPDKLYQDNVQVSTPWTDADGWEHTGQVNKHDEEYTIIPPTYYWHRPNNTYGDDQLPPPPVRVRSLVQAEKDRAFGYPPRIGDRNIPIDNQGIFLFEDVLEEKAKLEVKESARTRGIWISRFWTSDQVQSMVESFDDGHEPIPPAPEFPPVEDVKPRESTRKRRRTDNASIGKADPIETPRPKRRRQEPNDATPEPNTSDPSENKNGLVALKFNTQRWLMNSILDGTRRVPLQNDRLSSDIKDDPEDSLLPITPAKSDYHDNTDITPNSVDDTTPGGRPRRRAANALMANFQKHAEARAQRAERARMGHARRKAGTPLKTVTGVHGDTVESPIRQAIDPMNID